MQYKKGLLVFDFQIYLVKTTTQIIKSTNKPFCYNLSITSAIKAVIPSIEPTPLTP